MYNQQHLVVILTSIVIGLNIGTISPVLAADHHGQHEEVVYECRFWDANLTESNKHLEVCDEEIIDEGSCGYDDPNPDSFEVDQLCEELGNDPECFTDAGELIDRCAQELEQKGSKEYERYKEYKEYEEDDHDYKEYEDTRSEYDKKVTGIMEQHVSFPQKPSYYGYIQFNVNGYKDTYDAEHYLKEFGTTELIFNYEYYGYKPETTKACITNMDSLKQVCQTVKTGTEHIFFTMPD